MAKELLILLILMMVTSSFSTGIYASLDTREVGSWFQTMGCNGNEMTAKLHFYIQDFISGRNETVYEVARASITSTSPTSFGLVQVLDDVMTGGPDMNSKPLGRFQGFFAVSDLRTTAYTLDHVGAGPHEGKHDQYCGQESNNAART
ncbi:UNVERIFIED_CONTAM: Dirigent protein 11 [Sesamum radiatum]|uniref:Dirigent protein n=1 Tax=Sesamum radiatum TaxID=300843 RepID=A0AAW2MSD7_SESRA